MWLLVIILASTAPPARDIPFGYFESSKLCGEVGEHVMHGPVITIDGRVLEVLTARCDYVNWT